MFIFLGILLAISAILFIIGVFSEDNQESWWSAAGLFFLFFVVVGIVFLISYTTSVSSNAKLQAFYNEVYSAYKLTAERTEQMTVGSRTEQQPSSVILKTEHLQQAPEAAQRWKELRDRVEWYNTKLRSKREYYETFALRIWMAPPPADLPFIKMNE